MKIIDAIEKRVLKDNRNQKWIIDNAQYLTITGSQAYGTETEDSDFDVYGFTVPPKSILFPFHSGYVYGFDKGFPKFEQYEADHIDYKDKPQVDVDIFNITKYFSLCMDNNPNMIDTLFTPPNCVVRCTKVGEMVRLNKRLFLHKGSWFRFKGYAFSQLKKAKSKNRIGKRKEITEKHGYDPKFAMHIFRLLGEVEQILTEQDIDLSRNREQLKYIRDGNFTIEKIENMFHKRESFLEKLYHESTLRDRPDTEAIGRLLLECLEESLGSLPEGLSR